MGCRIRFAGPDDAPTLHAFILALATYAREPDAVEVTPDVLRKQMAAAHSPFECLLAERNATAVGFALFHQKYFTWRGRDGIYLEDLYVDEAHRGRGVGTTLLRRLARLAVERGCVRLEWSALDRNAAAIAFYEKLGAEALPQRTVFQLTDESLARLAARR
jgi:GNAT superfamily N-acetyltransferase